MNHDVTSSFPSNVPIERASKSLNTGTILFREREREKKSVYERVRELYIVCGGESACLRGERDSGSVCV